MWPSLPGLAQPRIRLMAVERGRGALAPLGRLQGARELAREELADAHRWGAPRALGRAVRIAGQVSEAETGVPLLREALQVLAESPALLECAKALIELGAAVRRAGGPQSPSSCSAAGSSRPNCGAAPLVSAYGELCRMGYSESCRCISG
jgi:hypothetical protein